MSGSNTDTPWTPEEDALFVEAKLLGWKGDKSRAEDALRRSQDWLTLADVLKYVVERMKNNPPPR